MHFHVEKLKTAKATKLLSQRKHIHTPSCEVKLRRKVERRCASSIDRRAEQSQPNCRLTAQRSCIMNRFNLWQIALPPAYAKAQCTSFWLLLPFPLRIFSHFSCSVRFAFCMWHSGPSSIHRVGCIWGCGWLTWLGSLCLWCNDVASFSFSFSFNCCWRGRRQRHKKPATLLHYLSSRAHPAPRVASAMHCDIVASGGKWKF